ncbi:MAG TPA: iron-sulfur cluster assembly scaffold protein [Bacillota bacterium]|nr:iron-sulfur cluster assembly scaffold protein [Bacillota bacterium]
MKKKSIYNEKVLELWKNPKNFGKLLNPTHKCSEANTICGDEMSIYLRVEDEIVRDAKFFSTGCLICIVFASKLTEKIKGMKVEDIYKLKNKDLLKLLDIDITPLKMQCACLSLDAVQNCLKRGKLRN